MAVTKGTVPSTGRDTGRPKATKKQINAVTRAARSKKTRPAAAARSLEVMKSPQAKAAMQGASARILASRSKVRRATRRAVRKDLIGPGSPSKEGLSITKNEGSRGLRRAVKTLGYKDSKKLVAKTASKAGTRRRVRRASA